MEYPTRDSMMETCAEAYRLRLPERQRVRRQGDLLGRGAGGSVEFQDRKDYAPGDDLRHVDWRAFARTDRMTVMLYREEVSPRVDLLLDTSLSMEVTRAKAELAADLARLFCRLAQKERALLQLHAVGAGARRLASPEEFSRSPHAAQISPLEALHHYPAGRAGGLKIFLTDLLFPFDPREFSRAFPGADRIVVLQVLSRFEAQPETGAEVRLRDAETGRTLDLRLDASTVRRYRSRLERVREDLIRELTLSGGALVPCVEEEPPKVLLRRLLAAGILEA